MMKLLVLVALIQLSLLQTNIIQVLAQQSIECDGQRYYTTCGNGTMCQYIQICLGPMQEYKYCASKDFHKPYCNQGKCSETPEFNDEGCPPRSIYCTGAGIFPDPDICYQYHNCTTLDASSSVIQCPTGEVFDPDALACKQPTKAEDCMQIKCDVNEMFSRYGTSQHFYGYCEISKGLVSIDPTRVFKCPDGTTFNGKGCSFGCPQVGRFGDTNNPSVYYECFEQGGEAIQRNCAVGKIFDSTKSTCITPKA